MKALATYELTIKHNANSWNHSEVSENRANAICPRVHLYDSQKLQIS